MKKTTKLTPKKLETAIESLYKDMGSTNDLYKVNQSVNQKVERSEQDVKKHLNDVTLPHFILTLFNTVLLILALIA